MLSLMLINGVFSVLKNKQKLFNHMNLIRIFSTCYILYRCETIYIISPLMSALYSNSYIQFALYMCVSVCLCVCVCVLCCSVLVTCAITIKLNLI